MRANEATGRDHRAEEYRCGPDRSARLLVVLLQIHKDGIGIMKIVLNSDGESFLPRTLCKLKDDWNVNLFHHKLKEGIANL